MNAAARLPSLYISHGSPMTALDPKLVGVRLGELARSLPRPRAVVIASAHWLARSPLVGGSARPETIHDFGGFPQALFDIQYPAPGAPEVAGRVAQLLDQAGLAPHIDPNRGLDHGMWVPLRLLYPDADVPVVPLSIQPQAGPAHQLAVGRALAPLRDEGVLVIGSGSLTHNLHDWRGADHTRQAPYVQPYIDWVEATLRQGDVQALLDYRRRAPNAAQAHPTDEHWQPIYVALGAAGEHFRATRIDAGIDMGFLAMDIYRFDDAAPAQAAA
ncbi:MULTISPECIES: class III extradiol ring-cleavage dioxygenase [Pseudoxanthomonas]|uniref:4,5-DOPA dioxygenase extradiol n=1 Tax=Pseudoxanthomonas winnipegensis TaxID=2480810 RepID=A0AAW8GFZ4_9GAMM|nr:MULTISPECIES: class III extradiol ring-cleavage dioxygenase [Pseudoxanthomonas]MDQ1120702.1 4,5-DOPA dioxygenase extradiol [Pseudoxanthomonas winnipegensis]MDQ1133926.1 4,5-DOPA dioxygenase extradiol [Pseudoxanthomonas winnipegensis]MDR6139839.1 4,5-DOPA dioxygenase extradiol [Pseudoxanthomonas sp. SORGH_AS_0997]